MISCFFILAVSTYSTIAIVLFLNKRKLKAIHSCKAGSSQNVQHGVPTNQTITQNSQQMTPLKRQHLIPFLIIMTFMIFYAVPDSLLSFLKSRNFDIYIHLSWSIGYMVDPVIYIFYIRKLEILL